MAIVDGWGRGTWGQGAWDENIPIQIISPTNTAWGEDPWGQGTFGGINNLNINLASVSVAIGIDVLVTGQQ